MRKLVQSLSGRTWNWIRRLGAFGLVVLGAGDTVPFIDIPPGTVDALVILLSMRQPRVWALYAFLATVGEVIGGYIAYRMAEKGGKATVEKKLGKSRAEKLYQLFEKRGFITVFAGAILPPPFPFTSVLMAAGVMQYPPKKFVSALTTGRGVRFSAEAWLGRIYGHQMIAFFSRNYKAALYTLIALAVAGGVGALVYFKWYKPRNNVSGQGAQATVQDTSTKT